MSYKTSNQKIWESIIGLSPKFYGQDNSFVTLMEKHYGIEPFVQLDFQKTGSSYIKFGNFQQNENSIVVKNTNSSFWQFPIESVSFGNFISDRIDAIIDTTSSSIQFPDSLF
jgi:hypothetical protein